MRKKIFRAEVEQREFKLFKALLREMYAKHFNDEINSADEFRIKIDKKIK